MDHKGQSKVWNRFLDISQKDDGSNSLISKGDSFRRKHKPRVNVALNENLPPARSANDNANNVFQEIVNFVTATNNKFQVIQGAGEDSTPSIVDPKGLKSDTSSELDNSSNVLKFVSNSVPPSGENNPTSNAVIEQLKNNLTLQRLVANIFNNTNGYYNHNTKLVDRLNLNKKPQLNKKYQEIKNNRLITNFNDSKKEPFLVKNRKTNLIADGYMLKRDRENTTIGDKANNFKMDKNKIPTTNSQQIRTMSSIKNSIFSSSPNAFRVVTSTESVHDASEKAKQVVHVSTECVRIFQHIVYNISDDLDNNGRSKKVESGFNINNPVTPDNSYSDNSEEPNWNVTTRKTPSLTIPVSSMLISKLLTTTEETVEADVSQNVVSDTSFPKLPVSKKQASRVININTEPTPTEQLKPSTSMSVNSEEEGRRSTDHLNDQNLLLQILEGLDQIFPGQDKEKDINKNVNDESEPSLKDLGKANVDENMKGVLNDMLGIKNDDDIMWKENKAAFKRVTSQRKLPVNETEILGVSTECVQFFNHTVSNMMEDLSNAESTKPQGGNNMTNSPNKSEAPFTSNNESDTKMDINGGTTTGNPGNSYPLTNSNQSSLTKDKIITEQNIYNDNPEKMDFKMINLEPSSQDQLKVNGNEEEDMKLIDLQNDPNNLIHILEGLDQMLPGQDKTKEFNKNANDEPEPVLKDLNQENVDENMEEVLNSMLGIKHDSGDIVWKENKAAFKMVTSQRKSPVNGTEILGYSTECVQFFNDTVSNVTDDLSNNEINKLQGNNNMTNSSNQSEMSFPSNNESDIKKDINNELTSSNSNLNLLPNSNQNSFVNESYNTLQNVDTNVNRGTNLKVEPKLNISMFVKDVDGNELKDMGLFDHLNDQNLLLQILESINPILPEHDKTKDLNSNDVVNDADPGLKGLSEENIHNNTKDERNIKMGIKQDDGDIIWKENKAKEINIPTHEDNLENNHIDEPVIATIVFP